jgi:hypothetical protein
MAVITSRLPYHELVLSLYRLPNINTSIKTMDMELKHRPPLSSALTPITRIADHADFSDVYE